MSDLLTITKSYEKDIIRDLSELIKIPSVSENGTPDKCFGENVDKALMKVKELFEKSGYKMTVKSKDGYAIAKIGEGEKTIGIFGHADVVPVDNDWIYTKPFEPLVKDGFLFGRGSEDDKAGVIASLYALKILKDSGYEFKNKILIFVGGSEETGMDDLINYLNNGESVPDVSIIPDTEFPCSIGEKGIFRLTCTSQKSFDKIKNAEGGRAFNVILGEALVELDGVNKEAVLDLTENVTETENGIKISVKGLAKHAAYPEGGENAFLKASKYLCDNNLVSGDDYDILKGFSELFKDNYGTGFGIAKTDAFDKLSCANGIIETKNGKLTFSMDIRYGNESNAKDMLDKIEKATKEWGFKVNAESVEDDPGFLIDENSELTKGVLSAYMDITGKTDAKPFKSAGGTYARKLKNAYSVGVTTFNTKKPEMPVGHGDIHQSDECISINDYIEGISIIAGMLKNIDSNM